MDSLKKLFGGGQSDTSASADTVATPEVPATPTVEAPADMGGSGMEAPTPEGSLDSTPPVA